MLACPPTPILDFTPCHTTMIQTPRIPSPPQPDKTPATKIQDKRNTLQKTIWVDGESY